MQKKALLALLLVLTLTLSGCALIQKDMEVDRATEIIRVGDTVYTKGELQDEVNYQLYYMYSLYSQFGLSYDVTDPANIADVQNEVIDAVVQSAVLEAKAAELGFDQFTPEELADITAEIDETWQSYRDSVQAEYFADTELEGDELNAALDAQLEELGMTRATLEESEHSSHAVAKLRESVTERVTVTEEELQAALDDHIASAQSTYETSLSSYGISVNNGSTVYYRPAGYRMVKQILIRFADEDSDKIDELNASLSAANTAITQQQNLLSTMDVINVDDLVSQVNVTLDQETGDVTEVTPAYTGEVSDDVSEALQELAKAKAQQAYFTEKVEEATRAAFANIDEEADEVLAQLDEGADWDALSAEHNDDPGMQEGASTAKTGYAVCEGFSNFDTAFTEAAMAIPEVGGHSDKTEGMYGYYIIQYTSDVEEGPVALDEVREAITSEVLTAKQNEAYSEQVAAWIEEAKPVINRNALND